MADYNSSFTGAQIDAAITKVGGIEAGADVTDTANVTAAGALMDSEVTNLAAVKAFAPTDYATSAQGALADTAVQPGDDANTLGSGAATDGYVLTADGAGGAAWEASAGGGGSTDYVRTRAGAIQDLFDMADTWNDGVTTFTAIKMNVTDTASASGSLLMDLQVGGSSQLSVSKGGVLTANTVTTPKVKATGGFKLEVGGNYNWTFARSATTGVLEMTGPSQSGIWYGMGFKGVQVGLVSSSVYARLEADAANTLAQRNSTNAQTFNLYNTYTDASNYERGFMKWNSNVLEIGTEAAGTGSARTMVLQRVAQIRASGDADQYLNLAAAGYFSFIDNAGTETVRYGGILEARSNWSIRWANSTSPGGTKDAGLARASAGVVKVTDGSTGTGELIFIVPTSDPGITGALWNNGGTLAISA